MKRIFPLAFPFLLAGCPSIGDCIPVDYPPPPPPTCVRAKCASPFSRRETKSLRASRSTDWMRRRAAHSNSSIRCGMSPPISASLMRATHLHRGSNTISPRSWSPTRNSGRVSFPLRVNSSQNSLCYRKAINLGWKPSAPHVNPHPHHPKSPPLLAITFLYHQNDFLRVRARVPLPWSSRST